MGPGDRTPSKEDSALCTCSLETARPELVTSAPCSWPLGDALGADIPGKSGFSGRPSCAAQDRALAQVVGAQQESVRRAVTHSDVDLFPIFNSLRPGILDLLGRRWVEPLSGLRVGRV